MIHADPTPAMQEFPDEPNWEVARKHMELTLVLGRHADAADAKKILAQIEPGSVVFYENLDIDNPESTAEEQILWSLNAVHAVEGVDAAAYIRTKQDVIEVIKSSEAKTGPTFGGTLLSELLGMDCLMGAADYWAHQIGEQADLTQKSLATLLNSDDPYSQPGGIAKKGRIYRAVRDKVLYKTIAQELREGQGLAIMMAKFAELKEITGVHNSAPGLPLTPEGKVKTYLVYGNGHKHTLQDKLSARGVATSTIEIGGELPEWMYLEGLGGTPRQLAFGALRYARLITEEELPAAFDWTEKYNHLPPEEVIKLWLSAVQLVLSSESKSPAQVSCDLEAFYRTYLPERYSGA